MLGMLCKNYANSVSYNFKIAAKAINIIKHGKQVKTRKGKEHYELYMYLWVLERETALDTPLFYCFRNTGTHCALKDSSLGFYSRSFHLGGGYTRKLAPEPVSHQWTLWD